MKSWHSWHRVTGEACAVAVLLGLVCYPVYLTSLRASPSWDTIPSRPLPCSLLGPDKRRNALGAGVFAALGVTGYRGKLPCLRWADPET